MFIVSETPSLKRPEVLFNSGETFLQTTLAKKKKKVPVANRNISLKFSWPQNSSWQLTWLADADS
jgi:hypothetical protein